MLSPSVAETGMMRTLTSPSSCRSAPISASMARNFHLVVADEIHLIHGKDEIADAHERADARVAARLREHALRSVHEDDGEIRE
jgi:hypothetical protein